MRGMSHRSEINGSPDDQDPRLFMQPTTDDASHDEALASRIAALNMLDLTLAHLDVLVGDNGPDVEIVVNACGESALIHLP